MKKSDFYAEAETPDDPWLERLTGVIRERLPEYDLSNELLAECVNISERHLFRRVKSLTGLTPQQYVRRYRLQYAMSYLQGGVYRTVRETAAAVGYRSSSHFIGQFEREFGCKPLDVLRQGGWR